MDLILIRHGQSQGNITKKVFLNSPLTALGHEQAESVGKKVVSLKPDIIASSSLQRAVQTATPVARILGLPINVWNNAHELRTKSDYDGLSIDEMQEMFPEAVFDKSHLVNERFRYINDHTVKRAYKRASILLDNLREAYAGKRVAMFLHGRMNQLLIQYILGLSFEDIKIRQPNGCINRIIFKDDHILVHGLSDITHLVQDNINF